MPKYSKNKIKQSKPAETAQENLGSSAETPKSEISVVLELSSSVSKHEVKIKKLEQDINNPEWVQKIAQSQICQSNIVKFILLIFLIILLSSTILFYIFIFFKINNLITVFEYIKDNNVLKVDGNLLDSFNQLSYETNKTVNFIVYILGGLAVVSILALFLKKSVDVFIENLSNKK